MLRDIALAAQQDILEAIEELLPTSTEDGRSHTLMERCLTHLDNLRMGAELTQMTAVQALCDEYSDTILSQTGEIGFNLENAQTIHRWMEDMGVFLGLPKDAKLATQLLTFLPETRRQVWTDRLIKEGTPSPEEAHPRTNCIDFPEEGADHPHQLSNALVDELVDDAPQPEGLAPLESCEEEFPVEDNSEEAGIADILGVFREEMTEIEPQLSDALNIFASSDVVDDQRTTAIEAYREIIVRVINASEGLELNGLRDVCLFIRCNLDRIKAGGSQLNAHEVQLFGSWPYLVSAYLGAPSDEQLRQRLVQHLQDQAWPEALGEPAARDLLESLAVLPSVLGSDEAAEPRQTKAQVEDVALEIADDVNPELINAFFQEAPTYAANFSSRMVCVVAGEDVADNVEAAQRLTHTLKGAANLIGVRGVANLAHHLEDILEHLAKQKLTPPPALASSLQEAADCLEAMIEALQGVDTAPESAVRILQEVLDWANSLDQGRIDVMLDHHEEVTDRITISARGDSQPAGNQPPATATSPPVSARIMAADVLHVPAATVDNIFRMVGEASIAVGRVQEHLKRLLQQSRLIREQDHMLQQRRIDLEHLVSLRSFSGLQHRLNRVAGAQEVFDSLELDEYDELYSSAHRFIETVADSRAMGLQVQDELLTLEGLFAEQQVLNKELQQSVMAMRMVPVASIVSRLQRGVRQACRATGKQAGLEIEGAELLLDGEVLDKLVDPLMHLLRNAIDHGIEAAEERLEKNKSASGRLTLTFSRGGNSVEVRLRDDGRGLDYDRIHERAIELGVIEAQQPVSREELARFILIAGFSTRKTATQVSGRGVGMDVVHNAIRELKGRVDITDAEGSGCLISLRLPVTLITSHTVLVKVGNSLYAVPTNVLEQILPPRSGRFMHFGEDLTFTLDEEAYPTEQLAQLLGAVTQSGEQVHDAGVVLLVRVDAEVTAVVVDQVVSSHDLVVKGLGRYINHVRGIAGVSILGDGNIVAVLDLPDLLRSSSDRMGVTDTKTPFAPSEETPESPSVLIVDDSLSVRKSLAEVATDAGYEAILARDGMEAVGLLLEHTPKLALVDLEMPNMNGLELTSHIRSDEKLSDLPVIMITSRTQQKHQQQAQAAGVSAYLTKPYSEEELLDTMGRLVQHA